MYYIKDINGNIIERFVNAVTAYYFYLNEPSAVEIIKKY